MNKEYVGINGNVIVSDENGNLAHLKLTENIEEVLMQENIIEQLEKKILETKERLQENTSFEIRSANLLVVFMIIGFNLCAILFFITKPQFYFFQKLMEYNFLIGSFVLDVLGYRMLKQQRNRIKSLRKDISLLEKSLVLEKEKLQNLKLVNNKKLEDIPITIVDEKAKLQALKNDLELYFGYGVDNKRLEKMSELSLDAGMYYTKEGLERIKKMLEPEKPKEKVLNKSGR